MECKIDTEKSEMERKEMMQQLFSDIEYKNRQKLMGIDARTNAGYNYVTSFSLANREKRA